MASAPATFRVRVWEIMSPGQGLGARRTPPESASVGYSLKLVPIRGGDHGPTFPGATNPPDYKAEMVKWFDAYLRKAGSGQ